MKYLLPPFVLFIFTFGFAQTPPIEFDGVVGEEEWKEAQTFSMDYEINPGDNSPAPHPTKAFVHYSATHLYVGYIARVNINYQFNQDLSFRLVGEYNDFDDSFFVQPLLKWNPNPFSIFYIGGTNGYSRIEAMTNNFHINDAQLYFKFQYLFDL